ncbi:MAG: type II toxin-antitoxin system VapC family toxin [Candidatus Acidiferrales bacterium]
MKYLLDTSVWLWSVGSVDRINKPGRELMADGKQELYLSAASVWEISIKTALGKLRLPDAPARYVPSRLRQQGINSLPVVLNHALAVYELPMHHTDPFDRLLIAQAQLEDMVILTADSNFRKYKVGLFWSG